MFFDAEDFVEPYCGKSVTTENFIVLFVYRCPLLRISFALVLAYHKRHADCQSMKSVLMTVDELVFIDEITCGDLFLGDDPREQILVFRLG